MKRILTDEHLDKLAKAFIYHTYGEPEPSNAPEPRISFARYIEAWANGEDFTADLREIQQYQPHVEETRQTVVFPARSRAIARPTAVPLAKEEAAGEKTLRPNTNVAFHP